MKLIVNADDFGLSPGTNLGILDCFLAGSVTSTTLMVNMPATHEAAEMALEHPALGVGLHFILTLGSPLSDPSEVPSLIGPDGRFHPRGRAEKLALAGRLNPREIARELQAQFDRFREFGLTPTHLDSHQHVHLLPGVFDTVAEFCVRYDLPLRMPWVWPHACGVGIKKRLRQWILTNFIKRHIARWGGSLKINKGLVSVFDLGMNPAEITAEVYLQVLRQNTATPLELMVHPARVDDEHRSLTGISEVSEREYAVLSSCNLGRMAGEFGYEVTDFGKAVG